MKNLRPVFCCLLAISFPAFVTAQFHEKSSAGQTAARQMNNPYNGASGSGGQVNGAGINRTLKQSKVNVVGISPTALKMAKGVVSPKTGEHVKIGIGTMSLKNADVWGRAENHSDGTYTETIFDLEHKQADNLVIQETKRKSLEGDDPLILTRKISLNHMGQPEEVRMYDGAGRHKYRGIFVYDQRGRVIEQRLWDAKGTPLRRTIQQYSPSGEFLPLKTIDYVKNVPSDLRLVITKSDDLAEAQLAEINRLLYEASSSKGFMANRKRKKAEAAARDFQDQFEQRNAAPAYHPPSASATPAASPKEVAGKRFQLFRKRTRN